MKALMKTARGVGNIELCDIPRPKCHDDEVSIKIKAANFLKAPDHS
jgi:NADPH:quinone reductase-like Zn-dependent oxidoreductase